MHESDNRTNWIIGIIVAFVVGLGLGWIIWAEEDATEPIREEIAGANNQSEVKTATDGGAGEPAMTSDSRITVDDQIAGTAVHIRSARVDEPTWIAIREDRNGALGNILGAQWLPEGTHENFDVELLRGIIPDGVYYAVLYRDDGDKEFNFKKDMLISSQDGVITARFTAFGKD